VKKTILNTAKFILALSGTLLLLELFAYNAGTSRRSEVSFSEQYGKSYTPGYSYTWFSEGYSMGSVNKGGYLGPFYKKEKPKGVKRIALLGDSYVEGFQVFDRNHFRTILENGLNAKRQDSVEVLNFGRSNFNFPNMYAYQELVVSKYQPDLSIFFVSREDLTSLTTDVLLPNVSPTSLNTVPFLSDETANSFMKANRVLSRSSLVYMLNSARRSIQSKGTLNAIFDGKFQNQNPKKVAIEEIEPINVKLFERLDKEKVFFVYREKAPLPESLKQAILNANLKLIDLSSYLIELEKSGKNPNTWLNQKSDGHWNVMGHMAVGTYLVSPVASKLD